jgi:hypothetical protein
LSTVPTSLTMAAATSDPRAHFTANSLYFYALFTLAVVLARALRTRKVCCEERPGGGSALP